MTEKLSLKWWNRDLQWSRNLPLEATSVLLAALGFAGIGLLYLQPVLGACLWHIQHHSTAKYQRFTVRVPWMWRQEDTPAGQREIMLVRARVGEPVEHEWIAIRNENSTSVGPQTVTERLHILASQPGQSVSKGTPIPLDGHTPLRFKCMAPNLEEIREWQATCLSDDRLWTANLYGPATDIESFKTVLQRVAYNPDPVRSAFSEKAGCPPTRDCLFRPQQSGIPLGSFLRRIELFSSRRSSCFRAEGPTYNSLGRRPR